MTDPATIKARVDCTRLIASLGGEHRGGDRYTCPWRSDSDGGSVAVDRDKWFDHVAKEGGDAIRLVERARGLRFPDALAWLANWAGLPADSGAAYIPEAQGRQPTAIYDYTDERGNVLYQALRYEPGDDGRHKTFRQRRPDGNGGYVWSVKGVRLVLYRLPAVMAAECVWIVEGEKDANVLVAAGECATTNVGGAGKWLEAYAEYLRGKEVVLCGDNDEPGRKHTAEVLASLAGKVAHVIHVEVPAPHKDIADYLGATPECERVKVLDALAKAGRRYPGGVDLPILSVAAMGQRYKAELAAVRTQHTRVDLGDWLPSIRGHCRRLIPGEVCTIIADTGVGKSMILQNIAYHCRVPTLFFEMELPETLLFERFAAMALGMTCSRVEEAWATGDGYAVDLGHVYVCPVSRMTVGEMTDITRKAPLCMGRKPVAVMVDYLQLLSGSHSDRYEQTSDNAESLKRFAKETGTVVFVASQRKRAMDVDIRLHDGKDSGAIENSSGLVLGAWRTPGHREELNIRILKNTKGPAGETVRCRILGAEMRIEDATEPRRQIDDATAERAAGPVGAVDAGPVQSPGTW